MSNETEILVVGGGLAGLTAACYAARLGHRCTALLGHLPGGQLLNIERIEGLPGFEEGIPGYDLCPIAQEQASAAGADCRVGEVTGLAPADDGWTVATDEGGYRARAVIVATGAELRKLGIPGEAELRDRGVGHCASCDAPLLRGKRVAVIGGGDSACQEGLVLAAHAAQVLLLHRGAELTAQACWRRRVAAQPNLECRAGTVVEAILGDHEVTGLAIRDTTDGSRSQLAIDAVFAFVGLVPNSALVVGRAALDERGAIITDLRLRTTQRGLLAAGSVRAGGSGQAAGAAGDGTLAAFAAHHYLTAGDWPA